MMIPIESLRNLGPKSCQWLRDAGITTIAEVEQLGTVSAFHLVKDVTNRSLSEAMR